MMEAWLKQLSIGIDQLHLTVPVTAQRSMLAFLEFLQTWNRSYNLTSVTALQDMITYHLLDSLSIAPYLIGARILDVGSGAGFPGIPLAFIYPDKQFVLLDSGGKKTRFLLQAVATFKLANVNVVQSRMENFKEGPCFDTITCRAVGSLCEIVHNTQQLICEDGQWLLMKGEYPPQELQRLAYPSIVRMLKVPGLTATRHLIVVSLPQGPSHDS